MIVTSMGCLNCGHPTTLGILLASGLAIVTNEVTPEWTSYRCLFCERRASGVTLDPSPDPLSIPGVESHGLPADVQMRLRWANAWLTAGDIPAATLHALGAAQVCEPLECPIAAAAIRRRVVEVWAQDRARSGYDPVVDPPEALMRADVMRRVSLFADALDVVDRVIPTLDEYAGTFCVFQYERTLIEDENAKEARILVAFEYQTDGETRKDLASTTPSEFREAGITNLDCLSGFRKEDVRARSSLRTRIRLHRSGFFEVPKAAPVQQNEPDTRRLKRTEELFEQSRTVPSLERALACWNRPERLARSTLVSNAELFDLEPEALAAFLSDQMNDRCPRCHFGFAMKMREGKLACHHCGWPAKDPPPQQPIDKAARDLARRQHIQRLIASQQRPPGLERL